MQTYGHAPKAAMIQEWKGKVADLVQNHVKGSRPSLSDKVAKLVKEMARESNQVSGKWMVFENQTRDMEGKWSKVKLALARSTLGPVAKLSESLCAGGRVMCIYTKSFEDFTDIRRVLHSLHDVGIHPTCWKADIMTYIGLYNSKNSDKEGIVVSGFRWDGSLQRCATCFLNQRLLLPRKPSSRKILLHRLLPACRILRSPLKL